MGSISVPKMSVGQTLCLLNEESGLEYRTYKLALRQLLSSDRYTRAKTWQLKLYCRNIYAEYKFASIQSYLRRENVIVCIQKSPFNEVCYLEMQSSSHLPTVKNLSWKVSHFLFGVSENILTLLINGHKKN